MDIRDLCSDWLATRSASYLCRENSIVYYASLTGRAGDFEWISLTLPEAIRIIRATRLQPEQYEELTQSVLITACQEIGKVYEFGTKSRFKTVPEVFNYLAEAGESTPESVMDMLATELYSKGRGALYIDDIVSVYDKAMKALKESPVKAQERNQLLNKHFSKLGYSIRVDSLRVRVGKKLHRVVLLAGQTSKDLVSITSEEAKHLVSVINGALK
tara:strand:- start:2419 stop:3063 length:645 start_codon:yes stop_codon:yes gene_type:complete